MMTGRTVFGEGVFESVLLHRDGRLPLWKAHVERLLKGSGVLSLPVAVEELEDIRVKAIAEAQSNSDTSIVEFRLKISLFRGYSSVGYDTLSANSQLTYSIHPYIRPEGGIKAQLCQLRLTSQPVFQGIKHCNRLEQILARRELIDGVTEGVLLDANGGVCEATTANIFVVKGDTIYTHPLNGYGVNGVMRQALVDALRKQKIRAEFAVPIRAIEQQAVAWQELREADAVILTSALRGASVMRSCYIDESETLIWQDSEAGSGVARLCDHMLGRS